MLAINVKGIKELKDPPNFAITREIADSGKNCQQMLNLSLGERLLAERESHNVKVLAQR